MKKNNVYFKNIDNFIIVDDKNYSVIKKLQFIVKQYRCEPNYCTMLSFLSSYYNLLSCNFNFICEVVKIMPRSFLDTILLSSEIEWFNCYNNN